MLKLISILAIAVHGIKEVCMVREPKDDMSMLMASQSQLDHTYDEKGLTKKKISRIHSCSGKNRLSTFEFTISEEDAGNNRWIKSEPVAPLIFNSNNDDCKTIDLKPGQFITYLEVRYQKNKGVQSIFLMLNGGQSLSFGEEQPDGS